MYYLIISSEENIVNIKSIKNNIQKLSDPRNTSSAQADELITATPLISMMMYSIHGNELSGTDASIQLAFQLAAGEDNETLELLDNVVTIIYPMENPDGRERFLSDVEQWKGNVPTDDTQSLPHWGTWPTGRTNHYHFDLNRDWFILSQPETRSRVSIMMEWFPQFVVDAHEMGSFSSFLFNPPREPINPYLDKKIQDWWNVFAKDQAAAMDKYGWSYYTREWLEDWFPGYGSSYPSFYGGVSILYEQARTAGLNVKRPEGRILTYAESVQHQYVSSIANLTTAAKNKSELMRTFYDIRKAGLTPYHPNGVKAYVFDVSENRSRIDSLMKVLEFQGVEIFQASEDFHVTKAKSYLDKKSTNKKFSERSYIIPLAQPHQALINAVLDFDTRLKTSFLKTERESLLKGNGSELYEVTSWSLPLAFAVDAYESYSLPSVKMERASFEKEEGKLVNPSPQYGYLIEYKDDNVIKFLKDLLEADAKVHSAKKEFKVENREYDNGTLLLRLEDNSKNIEETLTRIARKHSIEVIGVNTALAQSGADLGGGEFNLLEKPKAGFLVGQRSSIYNFGELWYLLDNGIGLKTSMLYLDNLGLYDLRKYNVLILPSSWGNLKDTFTKSVTGKLKTWIEEGGTLIAIGSSISVIADSSIAISNVKTRRDNLKKLNNYYKEVAENIAAQSVLIDSVKIWESASPQLTSVEPVIKIDEKEESERDRSYIKFMPQGSILNITLNDEHWLSNGVSKNLPVFYSSSYSFYGLNPAEVVGRLESPDKLRLSGLLWQEAQHRLAYASYLTRERLGRGQIISFADVPFFRAQFHGTARLFLNAIFLGPGMGASQAVEF
ncbi:hypothetical protein ASZ90_004412 [hydrocarbon metagenome]|uniref:Peptidase M14 domain-containing protein n=1 Tax=hydrocarbon metagenome TaxID=938273 RepID=A0A0W8FYB1_9ZZZZ